MSINKQYKDRLFRLLFGDERYKQNALELYNGINGTDYSNPDELVFDTIDDVIYMGMKNDVSLIIHDRLAIYEQQSTYNPNMPVRGLMYFGKLYDKFIKMNDLDVYGKTLLSLPAPQYIVFYNGTEATHQDKDVFELKLSDSFGGKEGCVELTAKVYNVNYGHNARLMEACKALSGYAEFVKTVRDYGSTMDMEDAVERAVEECISRGILADILTANRAEVKDMVLTEYNENRTMSTFFNEGRAEGMDRVSKLVNYLAKQDKTDEILKVTSDPEYRDQMLNTLNL